jgi:hypothetical protein
MAFAGIRVSRLPGRLTPKHAGESASLRPSQRIRELPDQKPRSLMLRSTQKNISVKQMLQWGLTVSLRQAYIEASEKVNRGDAAGGSHDVCDPRTDKARGADNCVVEKNCNPSVWRSNPMSLDAQAAPCLGLIPRYGGGL